MNPGEPSSLRPRFGVEEEFLVVDPVTRGLAPAAAAVLERAKATINDLADGEISKTQVETRTPPCDTVAGLYAQLVETRRALCAAAVEAELRVVATGSPVLGQVIPPPITEGERQDRGTAMFRGLHDDLEICATHVHVELPDRERALFVSNHLRAYLPTLIALAANSPFWGGRDTGYASWRLMTWARWPVAGPPPYFTSLSHYDHLVRTMTEAGALVDNGTIFWDVRPSTRWPTLEVRVADVLLTAEQSALLAGLVRALVVTVLPRVDSGDPGPVLSPELLRAAYWRAARDGLSGHGIDVHTGRLAPAVELAEALLETVRPALARLGDLAAVEAWFAALLRDGDGATRQRAVMASTGSLADVVDYLIEHTAPAAQ